MSRYFRVANITKKEFLHPHKFNDGLMVNEFAGNRGGTMFALGVLLATGFEDGDNYEIPGRWAGDKIAIVGDGDDDSKFRTVYEKCDDLVEYTDISYLFLHWLFEQDFAGDYADRFNTKWTRLMWMRDGESGLAAKVRELNGEARDF